MTDAYDLLHREAQHDVMCLERGPYYVSPATGPAAAQPVISARGVRIRTVYHQDVTAHEAVLAQVRAAQTLGEEARVHPEVPMRLFIADRTRAMVILPQQRQSGSDRAEQNGARPVFDGLMVFASPMLDGLVRLFDLLWNLAIPIDLVGGEGDATEENHRQLLSMLTAGLTDAAIVRSLGVSERTVQRRIGTMQEVLGAKTRYLLGVQAARRGWI